MHKMDKLIRELVTAEPELSIIMDYAPNVVIVPVILTEDSTAITRNVGRLEYQVSDGVPGIRGMSNDVYKWADVKKAAKHLQNS